MSIDGGRIISYADDTVIILNSHTWQTLKSNTISAMSKTKNWLDTYKLSLNVDKTVYVAFSITEANRPDFHNIFVDDLGGDVREVPQVKYLGVLNPD